MFIELNDYKNFSNGVYRIDSQGELNFISRSSIPGQFSINGTTYVTRTQGEAYNFDTDTYYFLRNMPINSRSGFPNEEGIAFIDALNDDVLYVYSLAEDIITDSVTINDLPDLGDDLRENLTSFRFANPILTQDNRVLFMTVNTTQNSSNDNCR